MKYTTEAKTTEIWKSCDSKKKIIIYSLKNILIFNFKIFVGSDSWLVECLVQAVPPGAPHLAYDLLVASTIKQFPAEAQKHLGTDSTSHTHSVDSVSSTCVLGCDHISNAAKIPYAVQKTFVPLPFSKRNL